jgi:hypothetical protein
MFELLSSPMIGSAAMNQLDLFFLKPFGLNVIEKPVFKTG